MSTKKGNVPRGPPKHQNKVTFVPNRSLKKKAKEVGGSLGYKYGDITGVCFRCKDIIEWKRKYGKYKALTEAQKCAGCGKRAVRQAYHALCPACAEQRGVCAKCMQAKETTGRSAEQEEMERAQLEKAMSTLRERDRRTLLRTLQKGVKSGNPQDASTTAKVKTGSVEGADGDEEGDDDEAEYNYSDEGEVDEDGEDGEEEDGVNDGEAEGEDGDDREEEEGRDEGASKEEKPNCSVVGADDMRKRRSEEG